MIRIPDAASQVRKRKFVDYVMKLSKVYVAKFGFCQVPEAITNTIYSLKAQSQV